MKPLSKRAKCLARATLILVAMAALLLATACGSGNGSIGGGGGGGNQGFSNSSLNGQYAFTVKGVGSSDGFTTSFFVEGGVFTADGNGHLTAIIDDFVDEFTPVLNTQPTGTYFVNTDGSGQLSFDFGGGNIFKYRVTLSDTSHFQMEEADFFNTSAGSGEKQDTSAFSSVPAGTFVLQNHDLFQGSARVGVSTWAAGAIVGTGDVLSGHTLSPVNITGTAQAPSTATGRGTVTIIDDLGTSHYVYYVVNSRKLRLLNTDAAISLEIGQLEAQTGTPFSAASLNGNYVFGSAGENGNVAAGIHSVGLFTADGTGGVTAGSFDFVENGTPFTAVSLNAGSSYTVAANGRVDVKLNLSTGLTNEKVMYMVSPARAFFLVNDAINVEDGTLDKQSGTFSNSSFNGQASFFMDGFDSFDGVNGVFKDRVGTLTPDGSGSIRTNYRTSVFDPNLVFGDVNDFTFSGTYAVNGSGVATTQFPGFTNNLIFYLSSQNTGYFLQADTGVDLGGAFTKQTAP